MATDPTRRIRHYDHPSAFDVSAQEMLERLSALPADLDVPYLTVTLDWTIQGENPARRDAEDVKRSQLRHQDTDGGPQRPSLTELEQTLNQMIDEAGPRGDLFDALNADKDRILAWIENDLDPAAQGVYIVVNAPADIFEATGLGLPIETSVVLSPVPRLYKLIRIIEDHPTYAVLQADQEEATLSFITMGSREQSVVLESSSYPRRHQQGGWSQRRFQTRADERIEAFARDICDELEHALRETGVETLILAGSEVMMSTLKNEMNENLHDFVAETIRLESNASAQEKIEATLPIADQFERDSELRAVTTLENQVGSDNLGVAGIEATVQALQIGQVDKLLMLDTFDEPGWADYTMHAFGADNLPTAHPLGGEVTNLRKIELKDEMTRLAVNTGASVNIIHSSVPVEDNGDVPDAGEDLPLSEAAGRLAALGGVGAILRYALDGDAEPETI